MLISLKPNLNTNKYLLIRFTFTLLIIEVPFLLSFPLISIIRRIELTLIINTVVYLWSLT